VLDELFFRLQLNRDVLTVLIKVAGVDAQGNEQSGVFDANLKRMMDLRGTTPKRTVDVRLKEARAAMTLLRLYEEDAIDEEVVLVDNTAFVRKFGAERLRRHAEPGTAQPHHWPDSLRPMMRKLAHAGARSFEREAEGFYTLDLRTDRCDCPWSHYYGVASAHGKCKHAVLKDFVVELKRSRAGRLRVLEAARSALWHQVHERERSKPVSMRCTPLYEAKDASEVLTLLLTQGYVSIPPTGKSTGLDDLASSGVELQCAGSVELQCTFEAAADAARVPFHDLGLKFTLLPQDEEDEVDGRSHKLQVMSFAQRPCGAVGPPLHWGDQIRPGDVIHAINGDSSGVLHALTSEQTLWIAASKPVTLSFKRPQPLSVAQEQEPGGGCVQGGRPAERQAKNPSAGGRHPNARGGQPARRGKKPQRTQARLLKSIEVPPGTLKRQAARVSEQLLGAGYLEAEVARLLALEEETYVP
jgi:hypothetical protein